MPTILILPKPCSDVQRHRYAELLDIAQRSAPAVLRRRPLGLHPACCKGAPMEPMFRKDYDNKRSVKVDKGVACRDAVGSQA